MFIFQISSFERYLLYQQYHRQINEDNFYLMKRSTIFKILDCEAPKIKLDYLKLLIEKWWNKRDINEGNLRLLKKVIKNYKFKLNDYELYQMFLIEERTFAKIRTLKILETNHQLLIGEHVYINYQSATLEQMENFLWVTIIEQHLFISNQAIFFVDKQNKIVWRTLWREISTYRFSKGGFEFTTEGKRYLLQIYDAKVLNFTIENLMQRKVKNVIKKRQNH